MAVEFLGFSKMNEEISLQEAASAGLKSMEHLIRLISHQKNQQFLNPKPKQLECREITDFTESKLKKVTPILNRTGHARFRRAPVYSSSPSSSPPQSQRPVSVSESQNLNLAPAPVTSHTAVAPTSVGHTQSQSLTLDFTKPNVLRSNSIIHHASTKGCEVVTKESFSMSQPLSSANSSFMSSITGEGSVSNGKQGGSSSLFMAPTPAISAGKPPISGKRCGEHDHSDDVTGSGRCHCKKRKSRVKRIVRVPAISSKMADIPPDECTWRKYGQKPIKGSPYPRGYYKCSSVRGCPARKHVERATDDPTMLIVTYEGEHRHTQDAVQENVSGGVGVAF